MKTLREKAEELREEIKQEMDGREVIGEVEDVDCIQCVQFPITLGWGRKVRVLVYGFSDPVFDQVSEKHRNFMVYTTSDEEEIKDDRIVASLEAIDLGLE